MKLSRLYAQETIAFVSHPNSPQRRPEVALRHWRGAALCRLGKSSAHALDKAFPTNGWAGLEKMRLAQDAGRTPAITSAKVPQVVRQTIQEKPASATQWSTRTIAEAAGLSEKSVHRIWRKHGLKPHMSRTFTVSNDPEFAAKLEAFVGLYLHPPEHAIVLCDDEKSQIQALDRTQPGPTKKGRCGTMRYDCKRNGIYLQP